MLHPCNSHLCFNLVDSHTTNKNKEKPNGPMLILLWSYPASIRLGKRMTFIPITVVLTNQLNN